MKRLLPALLILFLASLAFAQSPSYNPIFTALDANGDPYVGGKLYTYETGTTTPKTTWTDSGKGTPNANPVILDSRGQAQVWIDNSDGNYRFRLLDSDDNTIWTIDDIGPTIYNFTVAHNTDGSHKKYKLLSEYDDLADAISSIGGSETTLVVATTHTVTASATLPTNVELQFARGGQISVNSGQTLTINGTIRAGRYQIFAGLGTVTTSATGIQDTIFPEWWGDNTTKGSTDMTAEIQAAIDFAEAGVTANLTAPTVVFAPTSYFVSATITVAASGVSLVCYNGFADIVRSGNYGETFHLNLGGAAGQFNNRIENLYMRQITNAATSPDYHINAEVCAQLRIINCRFDDGFVDVLLQGCQFVWMDKCLWQDTGLLGAYQGAAAYLKIIGHTNLALPGNNYFTNLEMFGTQGTQANWYKGYAIVIEESDGNYFIGGHAGRIGNRILYAAPGATDSSLLSIMFTNFYFDGAGEGTEGRGYAVELTGDVSGGGVVDNIVFDHCTFSGPGTADSESAILIQNNTGTWRNIKIVDSTIANWGDRAILVNDTTPVQITIANNNIRNNDIEANGSASVELIAGLSDYIITGNTIGDVSSEGSNYGIQLNSNTSNGIVTNNTIRNHATSNLVTVSGTYTNMVVEGNVPNEQTVTATGTVNPFLPAVDMDTTGGAMTVTVGSGVYVGQILLLHLSVDGGDATVSVTNHFTSDPETAVCDDVNDYWRLFWNGSEWMTIAATCTI